MSPTAPAGRTQRVSGRFAGWSLAACGGGESEVSCCALEDCGGGGLGVGRGPRDDVDDARELRPVAVPVEPRSGAGRDLEREPPVA